MVTSLAPRRVVVSARAARRIDLCLFDRVDQITETSRIPMTRVGDDWTCDVTLAHGQIYALRADGPPHAETGSTFAPERLLLDPRARAIGRGPAPLDPLGLWIDEPFDWRGDTAPNTAWRDTVIYEAHVKGLTMQHPDVPASHRGTFLGLTAPAVIAHLQRLGVTAIELLPIHAHADEPALLARGLTNYWGYNTLNFFAPDPRFATRAVDTDPAAAVRECQTMVRELHRAGIEVILDVVYNHTAEGPLTGPTLSWRGLDPVAAYRRRTDNPQAYDDWTGCGNTLNVDDPAMRALVLDSLRYWVTEMHVDGFRFDLASALDRSPSSSASLFAAIQADPVLARVKLIAEPWDATADGHRLGAFPAGIAEWNGRYRDSVRRFWRGDPGAAAELATRLCGSQDLFGTADRSPLHSINFVTSHDGFTIADLVSYIEKHNDANGEHSADGESQNFSSNAGIEGPTTDPAIVAERATRVRSMLATLALSAGVPMFSGGDESGRSQQGNNNAYCQDTPLSWTPWPGDTSLSAFLQRVLAIRRAHPQFHRDTFLSDDDAMWINASGAALSRDEWESASLQLFGLRLRGGHNNGGDGASVLLYVNGGRAPVRCQLPADVTWAIAVDSSAPDAPMSPTSELTVTAFSLVVLTEAGPQTNPSHEARP